MQIAPRKWTAAHVTLLVLAGTITTVCAVAAAQGDESGQDSARKRSAQAEVDARTRQRFQQLESARRTRYWQLAGWKLLCAHVLSTTTVESKLWDWAAESGAFDPLDHDAQLITASFKAWEVEQKFMSSGRGSRNFEAWKSLHKKLRLELPRIKNARELRRFVEERVAVAYVRLEAEFGPPNMHWEFLREWGQQVDAKAETLGARGNSLRRAARRQADGLRRIRLEEEAAVQVAALAVGDRFEVGNPHAWITVLLRENALLRERMAKMERGRRR